MTAIAAKNAARRAAIASPANLKGWCESLARFGTFNLADVIGPALCHAAHIDLGRMHSGARWCGQARKLTPLT
jgi:hypothetical protein